MVLVGEVQTGLLQHSHALDSHDVTQLLSLAVGERVRLSARPLAYARSPRFLAGLDCQLPGTGRAVRVVGTAIGRATVVGGHVVQGSTFAEIRRGTHGRRLPWSYYMARPGVLETVRAADLSRLDERVLEGPVSPQSLNLGAVSGRTVDLIQRNAALDRKPPLRGIRTRLRWAAHTPDDSTFAPDDSAAISLTIKDSPLRVLRLTTPVTSASRIAALCEDIAVHDWLITTVLGVVSRAGIGSHTRAEVIERLQPAVDHLIPLWMPAARTDRLLTELWQALEANPGFARQWDNLVQRVRDQFTVATVTMYAPTFRL
ncbi:MAG TPA: SCO2521 family protein [Stackebrandtia sp.]|jgi:hypothetical protein|uniref:SCO2521 family protein n=1 Tax=Stackebrandtia sp. TaxID=2023065 RepID=UPI002D430DD9|nr:SCO2521 family protein [Stackebrandtia sp.]HZE39886.1 SCO2521 family protein [Stackebrandtia sp.]